MSGSLQVTVPLMLAMIDHDDGVRRAYDYSQGAERIEAELARKQRERERRIRELEPMVIDALRPWSHLLIASTDDQPVAATLVVTPADVGISTFRGASITLRSSAPLPVTEVRTALRAVISALLELS